MWPFAIFLSEAAARRRATFPGETSQEVAEFASILEGRPISAAYISRLRREIDSGEWQYLVNRYKAIFAERPITLL